MRRARTSKSSTIWRNLIPHPVFDTQVAAMVCGYGDSISYDQLVYRIPSQRIDKSSRFTDWKRRPLTQKQLDYALADVTHLRDVYQSIKANLEEQGPRPLGGRGNGNPHLSRDL